MLAYEMTIEKGSTTTHPYEFYVSKSGDYMDSPLPVAASVCGLAMRWYHECVPKHAAIEDMVFDLKRELVTLEDYIDRKRRELLLLQDDACEAIKYYEAGQAQ